MLFLLTPFFMKAASLKEIKTELDQRSTQELLELCLRLSKFKKENKESYSLIYYLNPKMKQLSYKA